LQQQGSLMGMLLPIVLFGVIFYFLILRPQKKRQKQQQDMLNSITRGDQVVTAGGFYGTVREVKDDSFILEIAEGVKVRILKGSISGKRTSAEISQSEPSADS
jgi:preprotein translocase subunit YajC